VHVGDLDAQATNLQNLWEARVYVTVHDSAHNPVPGVTVNGLWSFGTLEPADCTTDLNGICYVSKNNLQKNLSSVTFIVDSLSQTGRVYNSSANHDPDGDSYNGTAIIVYRKSQYLVFLPHIVGPGP
jgi:hypothetical protein